MIKYIDKQNSYISADVKIGDGTIIYPNVMIEGDTIIGNNCIIHMGCYIKNSIIGNTNIIYNSHIIDSKIDNDNTIGPYAHIRENNDIKNNVKVGSFVELKNTIIEDNSKVPHLSYLGDTELGADVNFGGGSITANFDGIKKCKTIIKNNVFIGSNSTLIAPIIIERESIIGAGSTITEDVPKNALSLARQKQVIKEKDKKKNL